MTYADPCKTESLPRATLKIEAVITCVNHADFLAHTLMMNRQHFDKIIVVTSPEDKDTPRICEYWRVPYHVTDAFQSRWGHFCKGSGINEGLDKLDKDAWICHLDADIALAPNTREVLEKAELDTSMIYGVDRHECKSWEAWQAFIGNPEPNLQGADFFIHTTHCPFPIGTRVSFAHHGGYIPIGFFQLWHADSKILKYMEGHTDAGREDSHFPIQWPRNKRALIPEIAAYHLESESAEMATNWKGRKTKRFGISAK